MCLSKPMRLDSSGAFLRSVVKTRQLFELSS
jgi:hypothetical protein